MANLALAGAAAAALAACSPTAAGPIDASMPMCFDCLDGGPPILRDAPFISYDDDAPHHIIDVDAGENVTLTGKLVGGTYPSRAAGAPLAGHQLSCITLGTPPVAASGTADATGTFRLTLGAASDPFGCFVLGPSGAPVAAVLFSVGFSPALTARFRADGDLGTIIVDLASGVAEVNLIPTGGEIVLLAPVPCPLGGWAASMPVGPVPCGDVQAHVWIAQRPSGEYVASYTVVATTAVRPDAGFAVCGAHGESSLPVTYVDGVVSFEVHDTAAGCDARRAVAWTTDVACRASNATATRTTCDACDFAGRCDACGTLTCVSSLLPTRE